MKYLSLLICAFVFFVSLNGCASSQAENNVLGQSPKKRQTFAESQKAELAELAKKPVRTTVGGYQEQARMENNDSVVETMYDSFGNKTESRVFYDDALLKMVVVRTSIDGQKQALVYGQNGEVKTAPRNLLDRVLTFAAREIAKTVEIFEGRKENEMLAKLQNHETPRIENFSAVSLETPPITENSRTVETAPIIETVETPAEVLPPTKDAVKTSEAEDSALKLRSVVQSLR